MARRNPQPLVATQQFGQRKMIGELLRIYVKAGTAADDSHLDIFPFSCRKELQECKKGGEKVARLATDLISSMPERQVIETYHRLTGINLGSALDDLSR